MVVIDTSGSTQSPAGFDVDGDGKVGFDPGVQLVAPGTYPPGTRNTDTGDSILVAEVMGVCAWVALQDPPEDAIGIVSFAGSIDPKTGGALASEPAARRVVEPTRDYSQLEMGLNEIMESGSSGGTDYSAALRVATQMLDGPDAVVDGGQILFLTDGLPSLPAGSARVSDPGDHEAAVIAARLAKKLGIRVHMILIGPKRQWSLLDSVPDIAEFTGGSLSHAETGENLTELLSAAAAGEN